MSSHPSHDHQGNQIDKRDKLKELADRCYKEELIPIVNLIQPQGPDLQRQLYSVDIEKAISGKEMQLLKSMGGIIVINYSDGVIGG